MATQNFSPNIRNALDDIAKMFHLSDARLKEITKHFIGEMELGLREHSHPMAMIPTFATDIPNGTEKGTFLVVDFAATIFRVSSVTLDGERGATQKDQVFTMPNELQYGTSTDLFDFLADAVAKFITEHGLEAESEPFKLGFACGFPLEKTAINRAKLLAWSHGFAVEDAIGKDIVELLQDALDRKQLPVHCQSVINDTVAIFLSEYYRSGSCAIGAVFGSGTNGAYLEDVSKISKLKNFTSDTAMVINTEWGSFDTKKTVLPFTPFDDKLDRESPNRGAKLTEKLTAGFYLGEVARHIITSLIEQNPPLLFNGSSTSLLDTPYGFDTQHVAMIKGAASVKDVKQVLADDLGFDASAVTDQDAGIVKWVCDQVGTRAAKLSGCCVAGILIHQGHAQGSGRVSARSDKLVVAAEGNLIRFCPWFETEMRQSLVAIVGAEVESRVEIKAIKDGKAIGAAVLDALLDSKA